MVGTDDFNEELSELETLDRIKGNCTFPELYSFDEKEKALQVVCHVLGGWRDIGIYSLSELQSGKDFKRETTALLGDLGVKSQIIHLTPGQRALLQKDNQIVKQLMELQKGNDKSAERARSNLFQIYRLSNIVLKSYSVIQLGVIRGFDIIETESQRISCKIYYNVLLRDHLKRAQHYVGASELVQKDLIEKFYEKGVPVDTVKFEEVDSECWKHGDSDLRFQNRLQSVASLSNSEKQFGFKQGVGQRIFSNG